MDLLETNLPAEIICLDDVLHWNCKACIDNDGNIHANTCNSLKRHPEFVEIAHLPTIKSDPDRLTISQLDDNFRQIHNFWWRRLHSSRAAGLIEWGWQDLLKRCKSGCAEEEDNQLKDDVNHWRHRQIQVLFLVQH